MPPTTPSGSWTNEFPQLAQVADVVGQTVIASARRIQVPPETVIFRDGDPCEQYMLVLDGSLRVQKTAENGRGLTLYRVEKGQSCVLTTSCLLAGDAYPAEGVTETSLDAVTIAANAFRQGLNGSDTFRQFVFHEHARRISSLVLLVEALAFGRIDSRLAGCLLSRAGAQPVLETTHQQMAIELGTAREVVSRQLKEFERKGWIRLQRGRIELVDLTSLAELARHSAGE